MWRRATPRRAAEGRPGQPRRHGACSSSRVARRLLAVVASVLWLSAAEASPIDQARAELAVLAAPHRVGPTESRVESRAFFTPSIGAEMHYFVYLPPGY